VEQVQNSFKKMVGKDMELAQSRSKNGAVLTSKKFSMSKIGNVNL
jgi:hypothetical protein